MKVVLINPDIVDVSKKYQINTFGRYPATMPLGLLYLAAVLEQKGHSVKIYDNALTELPNQQLIRSILVDEPDVIGLSVTFKNIGNARTIARTIKSKRRQTRIVFGGPQVSYFPEEIIKLPYVDLLVLGEAETNLPIVLDKNMRDINNVPNIYYKDDSGKPIQTQTGPPVEDLDALPYPARHLVNIKAYKQRWPQLPVLTMISSRGCPYRCTFCSLPVHCKKYRTRNPIKVVDEMEYLVKHYGAKMIAFMEDNLALNKRHAEAISQEIIKRDLKIKWSCETRVNNITPELLKIMKQAGLQTILFGVESGSQRMLDLLKKDITIAEVKQAFGWCRQAEVKTFASFMLGLPGETKADVFESFDFMCQLNPDQFSFQTFVGIPGSELYDHIKNNKLYSATWETSLIVSTKEFTRKEIIKLEKEIAFRSQIYKLVRPLKLNLPAKNHDYHYNLKHLKDLPLKLSEALASIKQDQAKAIRVLNKIGRGLEKLKKRDAFSQVILAYVYLLLGTIHSIKDEKAEAKQFAEKAASLDKTITIPFKH